MQHTGNSADVAIVGAGVIGLAIAERLARGGNLRVVLYEKEGIGAEASGVQPGGVRKQWGTRLNCELALESTTFYSALGETLGTSNPPVLEPCGYLFIAHTDTTLARLQHDVSLQQELGIPSRLLSPVEIEGVVPGFQPAGALGAAFSAEDGFFDRPQGVVEAFAEAAFGRGAALEIGQVERLERNGAGWDLELTDGRVESAERVVIAAGYHSPALLQSLDYALPIEPVTKYLFLSEPIRERLLDPFVVAIDHHFAAKHLASGRVLASYLTAEGDPESSSADWRGHIRVTIDAMLPILEYVTFGLLVEGIYDVTPDNHPIIAPLDAEQSLWVAAGFSGHGFMMAPAVARLVSEAMLEGRMDPTLQSVAVDRFETQAIEPELQVV